MPHRKNMSRLAIASLIAAVVSAPAAVAKPAIDTNVSPVQKPTPGNQHLRSEGAMAESIVPQTKHPANVDLRSESANEMYGGPHPSDQARAPQPTALPPGAPTWPSRARCCWAAALGWRDTGSALRPVRLTEDPVPRRRAQRGASCASFVEGELDRFEQLEVERLQLGRRLCQRHAHRCGSRA